MKAAATLRLRLVGAMLVILLFSLAASVLLGILEVPARRATAGVFDREPYQDGLVLAGFGLPALALIWLVSSWSLRPLARAAAEARAVGPGDIAARISRLGLPAEIVPLVDAVNAALDRMADAFAAERRFTQNAAHELRTPLAVLGLRLQRARQAGTAPDWAAIEQDMAHMNRLVAQLLELARKENAGRVADRAAWPMVPLARAAREASAMIFPIAEAQGRRITIDVPETLIVRGQADDLREALGNLLENAVLHGSGDICVRGQAGAQAVLTVSDEGPGVAPGEAAAVFERFHKGSRSEGIGLGLAIVREVARSHGGEVAFLEGAPGRVEMRLPLPGKKEGLLF